MRVKEVSGAVVDAAMKVHLKDRVKRMVNNLGLSLRDETHTSHC